MPVAFTIDFICHNDFELLEKTIPQNLSALCANTKQSFDVILTVDGAEKVDAKRFLEAAPRWGIDEVRFRWRGRNCATGDPSNNGHLHTFSDKTPYLVTLEGDIVIFKTDPAFDVLTAFRDLFSRQGQLALATRMDDHDTWVWKLEDAGPEFEPGIRSANRVASHFLVYDTRRARRLLRDEPAGALHKFYDDGEIWFNYEDFLSGIFAQPQGPGIAFVASFPIKVFHCDIKTTEGSVTYTKNLTIKLKEFERRRIEVANELR